VDVQGSRESRAPRRAVAPGPPRLARWEAAPLRGSRAARPSPGETPPSDRRIGARRPRAAESPRRVAATRRPPSCRFENSGHAPSSRVGSNAELRAPPTHPASPDARHTPRSDPRGGARAGRAPGPSRCRGGCPRADGAASIRSGSAVSWGERNRWIEAWPLHAITAQLRPTTP
jgi:hypothetical protein